HPGALADAGRDPHLDPPPGPRRPQLHRARGPLEHFLQAQDHLLLGVAPNAEQVLHAPGLEAGESAGASRPPEERPEEIREPASATPKVAEVDPHLPAPGPRAGARRVPERVPIGPELVVPLAFLGIGQHLVGFPDLLEPGLGLGVALVHVGMVLPRELAIGGLDLFLGGTLRHSEDLVVVLVLHPCLEYRARGPALQACRSPGPLLYSPGSCRSGALPPSSPEPAGASGARWPSPSAAPEPA